jgi:Uma2 family endonuclease
VWEGGATVIVGEIEPSIGQRVTEPSRDSTGIAPYTGSMSTRPKPSRGPFRADQLRAGDPYELADGHAIYVAPAGGRHAEANTRGAQVLATDPAVEESGVDVGYSPEPGTLRAPDIAVGNVPAVPGWVKGAPPLAVEYADSGQDEDELQAKIADLLRAGTRYLWVVRLAGARRVEIHEAGCRMRLALPGDELLAPGVLQNPVAVEALYDPEASRRATLRNLLQRQGYESLDAVRAEGETVGRAEGEAVGRAKAVLEVLSARGFEITADLEQRIRSCKDSTQLSRWLMKASTLARIEDFDDRA